MESVVSVKGQTVVPKEIREALGIKPKTRLIWIMQDGSVVVRALPDDPIGAAMGALKDVKFSTADLLADRRRDLEKEEQAASENLKRWQRTS
ncbi:MAG TPA: AbrB/MazE/SpoVT family DNA-binding domain-containing protein [Dehalococcoidia bacterium]|nr:AbrB/MazE/SpoVT family DNA-binding domain-containing protein [Dehalococcoidia bacterium]